MQIPHVLSSRLPEGHPVLGMLTMAFSPHLLGTLRCASPVALSMLCCEAYFTAIITTCFTKHFHWSICGADAYIGQLIGEG